MRSSFEPGSGGFRVDPRTFGQSEILMEPTTGIEPVNLILTKDALYQLSYVGLERETGFEPATHSLEGCCSSQLSYSRLDLPSEITFDRSCWWRGEDSNLRRLRRQIYSLFPLA